MSLFTHFGISEDSVEGLFFSGSSPDGDSVFLPCAGYNYGKGHRGTRSCGCYWLSTGDYFAFGVGDAVYGYDSPLFGTKRQYIFLTPDGICAFSVRCVKN